MGPEAIDTFRRYLLHGNKTEGLEHAMRAGLWGHALFLASKMDGRTYAGVMTRFANGLAATDRTDVGACAERPEAVRAGAVGRLAAAPRHDPQHQPGRGDQHPLHHHTLLAKGQLFAAHFCYIKSSVEWGQFGNPCAKC